MRQPVVHASAASTLPLEVWANIFEQTHSLDDAMSWQRATGVQAHTSDYARLVRRRAPALLLVVPNPGPQSLFAGLKCPAPNYMALCGPVFFAPIPFGPTQAALGDLYDAAAFMMAFAPASPITAQLRVLACDAWMSQCCRHSRRDDLSPSLERPADALFGATFGMTIRI